MVNMDVLATEGSLPSEAPEDMSIVGWDPVIEEVPSACAEHTTKATCGMCFALRGGSDNTTVRINLSTDMNHNFM